MGTFLHRPPPHQTRTQNQTASKRTRSPTRTPAHTCSPGADPGRSRKRKGWVGRTRLGRGVVGQRNCPTPPGPQGPGRAGLGPPRRPGAPTWCTRGISSHHGPNSKVPAPWGLRAFSTSLQFVAAGRGDRFKRLNIIYVFVRPARSPSSSPNQPEMGARRPPHMVERSCRKSSDFKIGVEGPWAPRGCPGQSDGSQYKMFPKGPPRSCGCNLRLSEVRGRGRLGSI